MTTQAPEPPTPGTTKPTAPAPTRGRAAPAGAFSWWVISGFGLLGYLTRNIFFRKRNKFDEIVVYSVHRSFYLWALILVGFVGSWIGYHHPRALNLLGWIYIWVLIYTFLSLMFDISTPKLLLWVGIFTLVWLTSKYIEDVRHFPMLGRVFSGVRN